MASTTPSSNSTPTNRPSATAVRASYCKMIQAAGIVPQSERREPYTVSTAHRIADGRNEMACFRMTFSKSPAPARIATADSPSFTALRSTPETWETRIVQLRGRSAFTRRSNILIKNGLIKGGSLENAVVIRDDAVLTTEPLRYPDEFVRHKMLDIVGDLSLLGRPLQRTPDRREAQPRRQLRAGAPRRSADAQTTPRGADFRSAAARFKSGGRKGGIRWKAGSKRAESWMSTRSCKSCRIAIRF